MRLLIIFCFLFNFLSFFSQNTLVADPLLKPFYHGVASGDPLPSKIIIWTRITPDDLTTREVAVKWKMATDKNMSNVVKSGKYFTNPSIDFTVKIDVGGLRANTFYYYQFEDKQGRKSIVGRTKTAPSNSNYNARFAMVSCANLEYGYFNAYGLINKKNDVDAVLCLGDYIYEYEQNGYAPASGAVRHWEPKTEILTVADYRNRYSSYRLDPDLRRNHQLYPWICIWDDHESANDSYVDGAQNHTEGREGSWKKRKRIAKQVYFEWIPIRPVKNARDPYQIYRDFSYGKNIDLIMLDTRLEGRDKQSKRNNRKKKLISDTQKNWMEDKLRNSNKKWKFLVQQVMMAQVPILEFNSDQWAGYKEQRRKIKELNIDNLVVLTGDIHSSWAIDLSKDWNIFNKNYESWGVEIVTPSVTAPGSSLINGVKAPYIKYVNGNKHGFVLLDIDSKKVQADWYHLNTIDKKSTAYRVGTSWKTISGTKKLTNNRNSLKPTKSPSRLTRVAKPDIYNKRNKLMFSALPQKNEINVLSLYPNPANDFFTIQYNVPEKGNLKLEIIDENGNVVSAIKTEKTEAVWTERYVTSDLKEGVYFVNLSVGNSKTSHKLIVKH